MRVCGIYWVVGFVGTLILCDIKCYYLAST
nr:MAG TPA: hypothetical protein [Bacteriophage sp.]